MRPSTLTAFLSSLLTLLILVILLWIGSTAYHAFYPLGPKLQGISARLVDGTTVYLVKTPSGWVEVSRLAGGTNGSVLFDSHTTVHNSQIEWGLNWTNGVDQPIGVCHEVDNGLRIECFPIDYSVKASSTR